MTISRWILLRMRNVSNKSCRENQNTHFMFSNFFRKLYRLRDNVETCGGTRGATNDVTIWCIRVACLISKTTCTHAHAYSYMPRHTHTHICNIYCFSMAKMVSRTRLNVTLYAHCLSCWNIKLVNQAEILLVSYLVECQTSEVASHVTSGVIKQ